MNVESILNNIYEVYDFTTKDYKGNMVEVFKNPTKKELMDIVPDSSGTGVGSSTLLGNFKRDKVRYLVYKDDVYVWNTENMYLHQDLANDKGFGIIDDIDDLFAGVGRYKSGKIRDYNIKYITDKTKEDIRDGKFDWLRRYNFDLKPMKDSLKYWF